MTLACVYHSTDIDQQMYIPIRQEDAENLNWNEGGMVESESPTEIFFEHLKSNFPPPQQEIMMTLLGKLEATFPTSHGGFLSLFLIVSTFSDSFSSTHR